MIPKLWSLLMLNLSRIIVAVENALKKYETPIERRVNKRECEAGRRAVKSYCQSHDHCEGCGYYIFTKCLFADDDEGIPCYWEVDDG